MRLSPGTPRRADEDASQVSERGSRRIHIARAQRQSSERRHDVHRRRPASGAHRRQADSWPRAPRRDGDRSRPRRVPRASFDPSTSPAGPAPSRPEGSPRGRGNSAREWMASAAGADAGADAEGMPRRLSPPSIGRRVRSVATAAGVLPSRPRSPTRSPRPCHRRRHRGGRGRRRPARRFLQAFLSFFFSEIGDKTLFIAVILATQQDKATVLAGTFGALAVMTVISVGIGQVFHPRKSRPRRWRDSSGTITPRALLLAFGVQTILGAEEDTAEEEEEDAKVAVAGSSSTATPRSCCPRSRWSSPRSG